MSVIKYSPKLPIQLDEDNEFLSITDSAENIKQKFRMLLLTNPGEKLMNPDFGIGIRQFLFEQGTGGFEVSRDVEGNRQVLNYDLSTELRQTIDRQISLYLPDIVIKELKVSIDDLYTYITIKYVYGSVILDTLELTVQQ